MTTTERPKMPRHRKPYYPTSDGKPMAETEKHVLLMLDTISILRNRYIDDPDVYVAGNNFVFYQEGNPKKRISPDTYVVFGVPKRVRDSYMSWLEGGHLPDVIFEFTSRKTRREDVEIKLPLYQNVLQVAEYFQFDPTGDYLDPRLQGYRLIDGQYRHLLPVNGRLHSEQLQLDLVQDGENMRLYDPVRGEYLLTPLEIARRVEQETARAEQEAEARVQAEAEVARLRAELEVLRKQSER